MSLALACPSFAVSFGYVPSGSVGSGWSIRRRVIWFSAFGQRGIWLGHPSYESRLGVSVASQRMLRAFGQCWLWFTIQCWDVWFSALGQRGSGLPSTSGPSWVFLLHGFRLGVTQSPGLACLGRPIWQFTGRLTGNSWGTALCAVGLILWTIGLWLITLVHVVVGGAGGGASLPPLGRTLSVEDGRRS